MLMTFSHCWLCQQPLYLASQGICQSCWRHLPALPPCCPVCGLPAITQHLPCGRCVLRPPPWQKLVFVSGYAPPLSTLITRFKWHNTPELAPLLARLMLLRWLDARREGHVSKPDLVLAVPLHHRRRWRRGFNQSDLLARPFAHWLGCDYQPDALQRLRATPLQQQLSAVARRRNLRGAFACRNPLAGQHIVLIDDVITTGSTVTEIVNIVLNQGAASVQLCCVCRTL